ncbi:MAG: hypothetical protein CM1200mP34_2860 [Verrucomicrobiales bacterium]|nr:MAG: hypothetical protein CM1200mP34_2860 [Verrucomicrobiales bacterium]
MQRALGLIHEADRFCVEVSLIIRDYLEQRFDLHAPDRTTEEFLFKLQSAAPGQRAQATAGRLPRRCDMVKFPKGEPPEQELRELHEAASRLVGERSRA